MTSTTPTAPSWPTGGTAPSFAANVSALTVDYGPVRALDGVTLDVRQGELLAVLGPSGCGKSSLLGAVAGVVPSVGRVEIFGRDVTAEPPERRGLGVVFQGYALFPHLSALDNVAFGLKVRGVPRKQREILALDHLGRVGLTGLAARKPDELSGGQRQRVALARALAVQPKLLLLDEPFANLDRPLHDQLRAELLDMLARESVAAILVTHDPADALVADRVAVLDAGRVAQVGPPLTVWRTPADRTTALALGPGTLWPARTFDRGPGTLLVRPGDWLVGAGPSAPLTMTVERCVPTATGYQLHGRAAGERLIVETDTPAEPGFPLLLGVRPDRGWVLPDSGGG